MADCPQSLEEFMGELDKFLHGNSIGVLKNIFEKIERDIQISRLNVAIGFLACLTLCFLVIDGAHFLCNFIGFVYPACVIMWHIEQGRVQLDNKKWLTYWVIYNAFSFVEYFLNLESHVWRLYWLLKCLMLTLCFLPIPWNGSVSMYDLHIHPFLQQHQETINGRALWAWESTSRGVPPFVIMFCAYRWGFRFLCNILGFVYPAYISMVSLMSEPDIYRMHWLTYWIVYSGCSLLEYVLAAIPFYYPVKFVLLGTYLLEPLARNALYFFGRQLILWYRPMNRANRLCHNIVHFFLTSREASQRARVNQMEERSSGVPALWNITPKKDNITVVKGQQAAVDPQEVDLQLSSPMVQAVLEMNVEVELIKKAVKLKLARDGPGNNFTSAEALLEAVFDLSASGKSEEDSSILDETTYSFSSSVDSQVPQEVIEENRQLKEQRLCKICMTEEVGMVFVPCGHLVCCYNCAYVLSTCPICRAEVESSLRTYMS